MLSYHGDLTRQKKIHLLNTENSDFKLDMAHENINMVVHPSFLWANLICIWSFRSDATESTNVVICKKSVVKEKQMLKNNENFQVQPSSVLIFVCFCLVLVNFLFQANISNSQHLCVGCIPKVL